MPHSPVDADPSWFKQLFDLSPDPTWIIDGNRFVECNAAAISALGYASRAEFLNVHPSKLSPPRQPDGEDSYVKAERMLALAKDQGLHRFEWVHAKADGMNFVAEVTLSAIELRGRQVIYCVWRNVTERKRWEEVLRDATKQWQHTFAAVSDAICVLDTDQKVVKCNQAMSRLAGAPMESLIGRHCWEVVHRTMGPIPECPMKRMRTSLHREQIELRLADRWLEVTVDPMMGEGRVLHGSVHIIRDITERKQAEEALRESEERWKFAIEGPGDGVWDWNIQTGVANFSKRWKEMLGWAESEIGNDSEEWVKRVCPEDLPGVMANIQEHLDQKTAAAAVEFRMLTKEGSWKWILGRGIVVSRDVDGKPLRLVGTNTDITERKQAEVTRVGLEAQLRESQKMEALGTLAGGVAHDFNNALAAILGNVELARQDVGPYHAALVSLDEIGRAGRRAKDLVQQILAFGRRQKLERKVMSLALVVVETARLVRATLPAMVSLNVDCKGDTPPVLADATAVKQILLNLCGNALQAVQDQARPGVIEIRLEACTQGEAHGSLRSGRYACLTVRDNGRGMDDATRSRIFEPFFTTKQAGKGTGLGLSVVHGMVQAHEASIEVESAPGGGSTFRIYFPAVDAPTADVVASSTETAPVHGKGKRVLYLDDEEAIIFLMKRLLERKGYRVSGYTEPRKALAAVRADPGQFDIAVTDYYMPGMSGLEVAQALQEIRPDLPVVMASGYISEELRTKAPAVGIRELIYKPNTVEDLCEAVARFANAQSVSQESP